MPEHTRPQHHFLVLDVYRFVAAVGVMMSHYLIVTSLRTGWDAGALFVGRFHLFVDFFFVLSGFVIALHYDGHIATAQDYGRYMRKRLARVYPLHLLTLLITLAIFFAGVRLGFPVRDPARFDMAALPAHFTMTHALGIDRTHTFNVPSWSLSAETFVYLFFPLLALVARRGVMVSAAFIVVFVAAFILLRHALGLGLWTRADFDLGALRAVPSFLAGIVIARLVKMQAGPALSWPWVLLYADGVLSLFFLPVREEFIILALALLVFLTARAEQARPVPQRWQRLFKISGALSYGVYMWHIIVATIVVTGGVKFLGESVQSYLVLSIVAALGSVFIAWAGYYLFEKPMQKALQGSAKPQAQQV